MRSIGLAWLLMYVGLQLWMAGVVLIPSIVADLERSNGEYAGEKIGLTAKAGTLDKARTGTAAGTAMLDPDKIRELSTQLDRDRYVYGTHATGRVGIWTDQGRQRTVRAMVVGTTAPFPHYSGWMMKHGAFFTERHVESGQPVAVLDASLAWALFGSVNVIGREIELQGSPLTIIGVTAPVSSLADPLGQAGVIPGITGGSDADGGTSPVLFMPHRTFTELFGYDDVSFVQWRLPQPGDPPAGDGTAARGSDFMWQREAERTLRALAEVGVSPSAYETFVFPAVHAELDKRTAWLEVVTAGIATWLVSRPGLTRFRRIVRRLPDSLSQRSLWKSGVAWGFLFAAWMGVLWLIWRNVEFPGILGSAEAGLAGESQVTLWFWAALGGIALCGIGQHWLRFFGTPRAPTLPITGLILILCFGLCTAWIHVIGLPYPGMPSQIWLISLAVLGHHWQHATNTNKGVEGIE